MGNASSGDRATVVTYPDEFAKREIVELARAAGYTVQAVITQKQVVKSEYGVGVGKAQELQETVAGNGSKTIIVDESLTSSQANRLSAVTHTEVVDRERLILSIFAGRANTTEAKLQVELAELRYEMPRAKDAVKYSVRGERAGFLGMGESTVDVKFRALKRRMVAIRKKRRAGPAGSFTPWKGGSSACRSSRLPATPAAARRPFSTDLLLSRRRSRPSSSRR